MNRVGAKPISDMEKVLIVLEALSFIPSILFFSEDWMLTIDPDYSGISDIYDLINFILCYFIFPLLIYFSLILIHCLAKYILVRVRNQ